MGATSPDFFKRGPSLFARFLFFAILAIALIAADARFSALNGVRKAMALVLYPLERVAAFPIDTARTVGGLSVSYVGLQQQNLDLQRQVRQLRVELLDYAALAKEDAHLRQLLGIRSRYLPHVSVADIIFTGTDPFSRKILIDKGSQEGVHAGNIVVDAVGVLGQVTQVYPVSSEVSLITDKDEAVPVQVLRNGLRAIVFGTGDENQLSLPYTNSDADIKVGDELVTSGIDGVYPAGLPVGTIKKIDHNPALPFSTVDCVPSAGTDRNRQVFVLTGPPPVQLPTGRRNQPVKIQGGHDAGHS
ncbi:MAG: rod shape-determining protein MreC [Pseudomonadota bacterium]|nr:rod shape-determining protein MreC [Pseudomonadota bacterium]